MENLRIYNKFRNVPNEAKKSILGGRLKGFTDINPMWRIKILTEEFGACGIGWYYDILSQDLKSGGKDEIAAFVTINLFVKVDGEWSKPIPGLGGSMFVANEKNGLYTSDECFKMALTDALGTACKSLGVAADVYFEKDRTKYDSKPEEKQSDTTVPESFKIAFSKCNTLADVLNLWTTNKKFQKESWFVKLKDNRKEILTLNGIDK